MPAYSIITSHQLLASYLDKPALFSDEVREHCHIPDDCYYTVSIWPIAGIVTVDHRRTRVVKATKISKSNQRPT